MVYTNPEMIKAARMVREKEEAEKQREAAKGVEKVQKGTATPGAASAAPGGTDGDHEKPSKAPRSKPTAQPQPKPAQGEKVAAKPEQGKKKMGRPAYPEGTPKRDKKITIWVTDAEREIVSRNAKKRGLSVSDYLRGLGLAPTSSVSLNDLRDEIMEITARGEQ